MTRDKNEQDRRLAQVEAIFDRRGLMAEERSETVVALLTELLLEGLGTAELPQDLDMCQRALARAAADDPEFLRTVEGKEYLEGTLGVDQDGNRGRETPADGKTRPHPPCVSSRGSSPDESSWPDASASPA